MGVQKKNRIFLKGLVHNFVQKIKHFPCFFWGGGGKIGKKRKCVDYILDRKKAFLGKKNKILKSRKIAFFQWGWSMVIKNRQGKWFWRCP